jgi:hypothetical protein
MGFSIGQGPKAGHRSPVRATAPGELNAQGDTPGAGGLIGDRRFWHFHFGFQTSATQSTSISIYR